MNPYYNAVHYYTFPKWHWMFLWMFPTYAAMDRDTLMFYKVIFKRIYIVGEAAAPWRREK